MVFTRAVSADAVSGSPEGSVQAETHFEWLVRTVLEADRRQKPFEYSADPHPKERRRWDLRANLFTPAAMPRLVLQGS